MASADGLSAPGSATYESDTLVVGDGTWDFTKNTFLLPNLVGLNFDTMQYNGMGNRFATIEQYHQLVMGHGILAAITFLFVIPAAVLYARFRSYGSDLRIHAYLQILAVGLCTVVFILGWFAVGPNRSLTNPHHGIGVAIYTMILVQLVGGRLVKNIRKKSFRLMIHRWLGRAIAILGIVQIPLGLTLYGSPRFTFILYAVWMAVLFLIYFILSWRHESDRDRDGLIAHGGRSEGAISTSEHKSGHGVGWLGTLAAGAGIWALLRGRRNRESERNGNRSRSPPRSRSRPPEVIPSQRGSGSYTEDEKATDRTDQRKGGMMNRLLAILGLVGAGALVKGVRDRRERRRYDDEEYSAVPTDTPSRFSRPNRFRKPAADQYTESEFSDDRTDIHGGPRPRTPLLPGPGNPATTATALTGTEPRPTTPRQSHPRPHQAESSYISDYSSYISPSRRREDGGGGGGGAAKGVLAALGLGWFAKRMKDRRDRREDEERRRLEDERRDGRHGSRFTGDGHSTPTRTSRRRPPPPASAPTATSFTVDSGSSMLESRPLGTSVGGPPMPPLGAGGAPPPVPVPVPVPFPGSHSHSRSRSRSRAGTAADPATMPPMPPDPHGVLHPLRQESGSESYASTGGRTHRRHSSRHRREAEEAAAIGAAAGTAGLIAEEDRRRRDRSQAPSQPVSVKVRYHDDRDRNITLRRLTEQEAAAARRAQRGRSDSVSSLSENEVPGSRRRYRRDSSSHRTAEEAAAERLVSEPLSPPTPAFAGGRRAGKDSAYYSGQPGPSGGNPLADQTVSSIGSPDSHAEWSAMSPSPSGPPGPAASSTPSAADRRRRRRLERRDQRPGNTVDFT
ncbi:hypothetical protein F4677DRAFT_163917 [Hypoxylon crocopeplum]|nr:hypothetical protein F4677DRAFT_163917 [Hypoxylon crocopeplum]